MTGHNPEAIIQGFRTNLHSQWEQHRDHAFNANTKGAAYESALKEFLDEYFAPIYNIRTRTAVIDRELQCFDLLNPGESELDVVSVFKQAVPGIIMEAGEMGWVPYDSVAFVCEVKSKLTAPALEKDLEKFAKLSELGRQNRFTSGQTGQTQMYLVDDENRESSMKTTVNHQLKCLVYDEKSIDPETLLNTAMVAPEIWDLILIVEDDLLIVSPNLPFVDAWQNRVSWDMDDSPEHVFPDFVVLPEGIVWFIILLVISIPRPIPFDASAALLRLVQRDWRDGGSFYDNRIDAVARLFADVKSKSK